MDDCFWGCYAVCPKKICDTCKNYLSINCTEGKLLAEELEKQIENVKETWRGRLK